MSQFYKLLKADKLGEPWDSHGKKIQNWWCQFEGVSKDVAVGKHVGNELTVGQHLYGDLMVATSQKGTEYFKFKSAKVPEGVTRPADSPAQASAQEAVGVEPAWFKEYAELIVNTHRMVRELHGGEADEKVDLDGIFGDEEPNV